MRRVVFDSDAVDPLIDTPGALDCLKRAVEAGQLEVLYTHVSLDERGRAPDGRRERLLEAFTTLGRKVATGAAAWGVSRWDEARWFGGSEFDDLQIGNRQHTEDALIGVTAVIEGCALVTRDTKFAGRARKLGIEVLEPVALLAEFGFTAD